MPVIHTVVEVGESGPVSCRPMVVEDVTAYRMVNSYSDLMNDPEVIFDRVRIVVADDPKGVENAA
jgi:hypothetical protein